MSPGYQMPGGQGGMPPSAGGYGRNDRSGGGWGGPPNAGYPSNPPPGQGYGDPPVTIVLVLCCHFDHWYCKSRLENWYPLQRQL